ncbi:MAG: hypothetical protein RMX35_30440 [Nostoc sp. DcaGUA01]|nr:hypothetical protein [Nostoc sp. DcaGUA01]
MLQFNLNYLLERFFAESFASVPLKTIKTGTPEIIKYGIGVNRRFVPPSAAYGYKPYTAIVTESDTRFKRDRKKISRTNSCSSAETVKELYLKRNLEYLEVGVSKYYCSVSKLKNIA